MSKPEPTHFVICIENTDFSTSLEKRKIYVALTDPSATAQGLIRVIDESGEDYLYPMEFFRVVDLPQATQEAVLAAA